MIERWTWFLPSEIWALRIAHQSLDAGLVRVCACAGWLDRVSSNDGAGVRTSRVPTRTIAVTVWSDTLAAVGADEGIA